MNANTAQQLRELNNRFYAENAASFAATRERAWEGWKRCLEDASRILPEGSPVQITDVAGGNGRFINAVRNAWQDRPCVFSLVDDCEALAARAENAAYFDRDIVGALLSERPVLEGVPRACLIVSFGFIHHVPTFNARLALIDEMINAAEPHGVIIISLWRFMNDERFARKAEASTHAACEELGISDLDVNDYILDWQGKPHAFRYCHHFADDEIDEIVEHASERTELVDRFEADGRNGRSNTYLVFQKN